LPTSNGSIESNIFTSRDFFATDADYASFCAPSSNGSLHS
jgi:hypothetical protein